MNYDETYFEIFPSKYSVDWDTEFVLGAPKGKIVVGNNFSCGQKNEFVVTTEVGTSIVIGDDCMFSHNITIKTGDGHTILDKFGEIINHGKNVEIGNHVWLAKNVFILKGVCIADNCVIGANSLVTKSVDEKGCIAAGTPATILKHDIQWNRDPIWKLEEEKNAASFNRLSSVETFE